MPLSPRRDTARCAWLLILFVNAASAQEPTSAPGAQPTVIRSPTTQAASERPPLPPDPTPVPLADEPLVVAPLGLTTQVPAGSRIRTERLGTTASVTIDLPASAGTVVIQERATARDDVSLQEIETALIAQTLDIDPLNKIFNLNEPLEAPKGRLIGRATTVSVQGAGVTRPFYLRLFSAAPQSPDLVTGFAVVRTATDRFVLFALYAEHPNFDAARRAFEIVLASSRIEDPGERDAERGAAVQRGIAAMRALTPEDFAAAARSADGRFERLFRRSTTGADLDDREIGYRRITASRGFRGEFSGKPEGSWSASDREEGYILKIDARLLTYADDAAPDAPAASREIQSQVDSQSAYFLSADRAQESWTVRLALRERAADEFAPGSKPQVWTEIGARDRDKLIVQIQQGNGPLRAVRPIVEGEGYISRLESFLLPELLLAAQRRGADISGRLAFYTYDQNAETIRLRTDEFEQRNPASATWTIQSRIAENEPQTALYNGEGRLIRTELQGDRIWEPTTLDRLFSLWRAKSLPVN